MNADFLQANTHFVAFFEIYKIIKFSHRILRKFEKHFLIDAEIDQGPNLGAPLTSLIPAGQVHGDFALGRRLAALTYDLKSTPAGGDLQASFRQALMKAEVECATMPAHKKAASRRNKQHTRKIRILRTIRKIRPSRQAWSTLPCATLGWMRMVIVEPGR